MALEAVVFQQDLFGYNGKDLYSLFGGNWSCEFGLEKEDEKSCCFDTLESQTETSHHYENWNSPSQPPPPSIVPHLNEWHHHNSSPEGLIPKQVQEFDSTLPTATSSSSRPKRRRSKSKKNQEEIENQRMTHIAVERNRRKQMNEYLSVLRSLMPESYVQRGDQASIIGGAINFVKELEQRLQWLGGQKEKENGEAGSSAPFSEFFTFPQYSTSSTVSDNSVSMADTVGGNQAVIADIEVTMVESHANLKIRSRRRPKQLLRMVSGLQSLHLTILHLNVTTIDQTVLYSLSVKVEDDCKLTSVDDIATAVYQMLGRIQEEAMIN